MDHSRLVYNMRGASLSDATSESSAGAAGAAGCSDRSARGVCRHVDREMVMLMRHGHAVPGAVLLIGLRGNLGTRRLRKELLRIESAYDLQQ